jgi:hypothetical protein
MSHIAFRCVMTRDLWEKQAGESREEVPPSPRG